MRRTQVLLLLLLCAFAHGFAQNNNFLISGVVVDSANNTPIELATVALKLTGTEIILADATADLDGKFALTVHKTGKYDLIIAFMGYNPKTIPIEVKANMKMGKIAISSSVSTLKEAVVTAERPEVTVDAEKTVFNMSQNPTNQIGTAEDMMRNVPGISIDQDGNISMIGKQGVKVLVDGRPNAQADNDLPDFLKSLPANSIESIELITTPSARYDAEGNAGIINIKLKKGSANGLNMNMSAGIGIINHYNANINVNYRKEKFNIFGGYSFNQSKTGFANTSNRILTVNDTTSYYNYLGNGVQRRFNNNAKAGFDYFFDEKNTLTYTLGASYSHATTNTNANAVNLDYSRDTTAVYNEANQSINSNYTLSNSLSFARKFDSTDHEFDVYLSHSYVGTLNNTSLNSLAYDSGVYNAGNSLNQRTEAPNGIHDVVIKVDYIHPLLKLKGYKIETGFKNESTINKNVFNDYNVVNNVEQYDTLLSNRFKYVENVAAVYGTLRGVYKKWLSYAGGLRIEQTYINGNYNAISKDYVDFFPNCNAAFAFNDTQNLSVSYNRRIQRPPFRYINNSLTYSDQFTTWQGNPLLQPAYSNNINLAYSHHIKKHLFVLKAGGTFVNNGFAGINSVDSLRITHGTEVNGANSKAGNCSLYVKLYLTDWWDVQTYYNYTYTYYGFTEGVNLNPVSGGASNFWGSMRFKFWKNTMLEVSGWANTRSVNPEGYNLPVGSVNASIKKAFLKDHLTVSIVANDIFNSMKWQWVQANAGIQSTGSWLGANRYLMINFAYRFGSHDLEERKQKEENERINSDGGKG